jgi:hypothetical protein
MKTLTMPPFPDGQVSVFAAVFPFLELAVAPVEPPVKTSRNGVLTIQTTPSCTTQSSGIRLSHSVTFLRTEATGSPEVLTTRGHHPTRAPKSSMVSRSRIIICTFQCDALSSRSQWPCGLKLRLH